MKDVYILKVIDYRYPITPENVKIIDFSDLNPGDEFIKLQGKERLEFAHAENKTFFATSVPHPNQQNIGTIEGNLLNEITTEEIERLIAWVYRVEGEQRD